MLQKCSVFKVAGIFFDEPTMPHYLLEISNKAGLAHTSTKKHLSQLERLAVIKESVEKKGKRNFPVYKANLESDAFKNYKRMHNVFQIEESGLINFLRDKLMPRAIVLFGSYSKGEDTEDSDIDLFVECGKEEVDASKFERQLNRKISLHFREDFKKYAKELKNNIVNGMVLSGYLEAF